MALICYRCKSGVSSIVNALEDHKIVTKPSMILQKIENCCAGKYFSSDSNFSEHDFDASFMSSGEDVVFCTGKLL